MDPKTDNQATPEGESKPAANAELDSLAAEASRVDEDTAAAGAQPGADAPRAAAGEAKTGEHSISTARLVQGALIGAGNLMAMRYPAVKRVYTADRCGMVGEALAPVLDRWGINAQNSVAMQYLVAVGALALLAFDTVDAIKSSTHENTSAPPGGPTPKPVP